MKTAMTVARLALVGSALLLMMTGMAVWRGTGEQIGGIHVLLGLALVASLWIIAALAARAGVRRRLVVFATAWSIAAAALGIAQEALLVGEGHVAIQVLHVVTAMGIVATGQALFIAARRVSARARGSATRGLRASGAGGHVARPRGSVTDPATRAYRKVATDELKGLRRPRW